MNTSQPTPSPLMATSSLPYPLGILLIAHGSRNPLANQDLFDLADRMASERPDAIVEASFLELAEPDIATAGALCVERGAASVLMIPYFLSSGVHLVRDLSGARDALQQRFPRVPFVLGRALGPDPLLDELVRQRIIQLLKPDLLLTAPHAENQAEEVEVVGVDASAHLG